MAAALASNTHGGEKVLLEMQFADYWYPGMVLEDIATMFQRSAGQFSVPVTMLVNYGSFKTGDLDHFFRRDGQGGGAAGNSHSECPAGTLAHKYDGVIVQMPTNAHAVQMALRNAFGAQSPVAIFVSPFFMGHDQWGGYDFRGRYLPLDTPLDPFGTSYTYYRPNTHPGEHSLALLTHGEYVPVCYKIAGDLEREGHHVAVVDYNSVHPIDRDAVRRVVEDSDGHICKFMVVTQERQGGFGHTILQQLTEDITCLDQDRIPLFHARERCQWRAEPFVLPHPDDIYQAAKQLAAF